MIPDVTKLGAANIIAPRRPMEHPDVILRDRFRLTQEIKRAQLYAILMAKVKNGEILTKEEKMQLALLQAYYIAEKLSKPVVLYTA